MGEDDLGTEFTHLEFESTLHGFERLERLLEISGVASFDDLFAQATEVFEQAILARRRGERLASVNEIEQTYSPLILPFMFKSSKPA